jgi:hypothetical protein
MSTAPAPKEVLPFTPEQTQTVSGVASLARLVAVVLQLLGAVQIVGGPLAVFVFGGGVLSGILTLLQGALTALLGMVMLTCAGDFQFLAEVPKYRGNHFRNAAKDLTAFYQFQLGLGLLLAVVVILRLVV